MKDKLNASEERYKQIVDLSPDPIFLHRDGIIIFMNPAGLKLFGASNPNDIIGQSLWSLYPPDRHGIVRARNQLMQQTGEPVPLIEHTMLRLDGAPVNVEAIARIVDYEGSPAFYVILRDISQTKKAQTLMNLQFAVSRHFIESEYLMDATTNVLKTICSTLNFNSAKIWTYDKNDELLHCFAIWSSESKSLNKNKLQKIVNVGEGLTGKLFLNAMPAWIELAKSKNKICVAVPIQIAKETIGILELFSQKEMPKDDLMLHTLTSISDQIGSFIKRKTSEKELRYLAKHDIVTGLSNRYLFEENLAYEINRAKNNDQRLALLCIDINSFSSINGAMGHAAGDQLLKQVSERILSLGVTVDHMSRFGDDQFALILIDVPSIVEVTEFIDDINAKLAETFTIQNESIHISVSIGVSFYPEDGADVSSLLKNAIIALTAAKEAGTGTYEFSTVDMSSTALKKINLENDLRQALSKGELSLNYQPIIDMDTMTVAGFEALLRWRRNDAFVSPVDFIPILEKTGLIIPVGDWLINAACEQCKTWQRHFKHDIFMSVNISQPQFKNEKIINVLKQVLSNTGLNPKHLKIEVTESLVMDNVKNSLQTLLAIRDMGIKIAIDDFGTGYSSLNYLRRLPIDFLKIDQSFVRAMIESANDAAIVKTIIELGKNLGYGLIAEGVETKQQLEYLQMLGCNYIQGYFFSRPLSAEDAAAFLQLGKLTS
jgi:diguanylate cyclase (GGDEF)-like protein/PAS domain S-box-containing protein